VSLEEMEAAPVLGEYLASCRRRDGSYVFSHEVALLWCERGEFSAPAGQS
jgi:hypothetical protein